LLLLLLPLLLLLLPLLLLLLFVISVAGLGANWCHCKNWISRSSIADAHNGKRMDEEGFIPMMKGFILSG